ncbi:Transposon Tf2-6 polyprotein [Dictyocoela roeselum]|nr:Transposon Tf2-6 polyprotein [Dictyocoela roeselum]
MHNSLIHPGENKLYHTLKRFFYVPRVKPIIKYITNNCLTCCKFKPRKIKYGWVSGGISASSVLEVISSDIFGPIKSLYFTNTRHYEKFYIITFTDIYSRFTIADILFDISSRSVEKSFERNVLSKLGHPKKFLSDQGRQYVSESFKRLLKSKNILHITTSAYNPTGNSISERINKTIGDIYRMFKGHSVYELKRLIETRLNHTYHRIIKTSPYEIIYQYSPIDPIKRKYKGCKASVNEKKMQIRNNKKTNKTRKMHKYKVGDKVFRKTHSPDKINDLYLRPFDIMEVSSDGNIVTINKPNKISKQNIKNITPFCPGRMEMSCSDNTKKELTEN